MISMTLKPCLKKCAFAGISKNLLPLPAELGPCLKPRLSLSLFGCYVRVQSLHHVQKSLLLGKQASKTLLYRSINFRLRKMHGKSLSAKMCFQEVRNSETDEIWLAAGQACNRCNPVADLLVGIAFVRHGRSFTWDNKMAATVNLQWQEAMSWIRSTVTLSATSSYIVNTSGKTSQSLRCQVESQIFPGPDMNCINCQKFIHLPAISVRLHGAKLVQWRKHIFFEANGNATVRLLSC